MQLPEPLVVCGIPLHPAPLGDTLAWIQDRCRSSQPFALIATVNVDVLMHARADREFSHLLARRTALNVIDGWPLVWLLRRRGASHAVRTAGADILDRALTGSEGDGLRVYLLGDAPETLAAVAERGNREGWGSRIVGAYSPSRSEIDDDVASDAIVQRINHSGADLLAVGFGAPRQERWMARWAASLKPAVGLSVGGALKFIAWPRRRAPRWLQQLGLEWLHRALLEPRRLAPRYARNMIAIVAINRELRENSFRSH